MFLLLFFFLIFLLISVARVFTFPLGKYTKPRPKYLNLFSLIRHESNSGLIKKCPKATGKMESDEFEISSRDQLVRQS